MLCTLVNMSSGNDSRSSSCYTGGIEDTSNLSSDFSLGPASDPGFEVDDSR